MFNPGDKVLYLPSKEEAIVRSSRTFGRKAKLIYTLSINNQDIEASESDVQAIYDISDPYERCANGLYGTRVEYVKTNTSYKIRNSNDTSISSLKASTTLFKPHQFKPLLKFINSSSRRILVADEVGLGKTIEAGHIMLELKARRELENVLIVCTKSLQHKWKVEMQTKFGLEFEEIDDVSYLINQLKTHNRRVRAIINYEKIRFVDDEENKRPDRRLLDYLEEAGDRKFSLVVCDEAHKMRNVNQTSNGARELLKYANAVVFLTATPVMTKQEDLYNLLRLLDEGQYDNYQIFRNHLNENRPFIRALSLIDGGKSLIEVADYLENESIRIEYFVNEELVYSEEELVKDHFAEYPLYQRAIEVMRSGKDGFDVRAQVRYDLSSMSMMNNILSRSRKKDYTTELSQAERQPITRPAKLSEYERSLYDEILDDYWNAHCEIGWNGVEFLPIGSLLAYVNLQQQLASSVYAYKNDDADLDNGNDIYSDKQDGKFNELTKIIQEVRDNGKNKLIVFANYIKTIKYLQLRLKKLGIKSVALYGAIKNRSEVIEQFQSNPEISVLVANEVASEGIDLQFCDSMVNYDLPWNPMVVEQRIGRIDRMGQTSPYVHIYNMIVEGSIQERILLRLLERIGLFRDAIGDMETILDAEVEREGKMISINDLFSELKKVVYQKEWSKEVLERKEQEVLQAIENERTAIKKMEEGFSGTLTNDAYFRQEIDRILNNKAYVTEFELKIFLEMAINEAMPELDLKNVDGNIYELVQPSRNLKTISSFLTKYQGDKAEDIQAADNFIRKHKDKQRIRVTFMQEVAYHHRNVEYLNIYHPLITSATRFFLEKMNSAEKTFCFSLPADKLIHNGENYFMAVVRLNIEQNVFGFNKSSDMLIPVLYNIEEERIEEDSKAKQVWAASQSDKMVRNNIVAPQIDQLAIEDMKVAILDYTSNLQKTNVAELKLQHENRKITKTQEYHRWFESRMENLKRNIRNHQDNLERAYLDEKEEKKERATIKRMEGQLRSLNEEREERLASFAEDPNIRTKIEIVSLSLVKVE